jgi:Phage capsid family
MAYAATCLSRGSRQAARTAGTAAVADQAFSQFEASPKKVIAITPFSKQLLAQEPQIADRVIGIDLVGTVGRELDKSVLAGTGGDSPLGILNTAGVTLTLGMNLRCARAMLARSQGAHRCALGRRMPRLELGSPSWPTACSAPMPRARRGNNRVGPRN